MKPALLLFIALLTMTSVKGQIDSNLDSKGEFQTVIDVQDSISTSYQRTKQWILSTYVNPKEIIVSDDENHHIKISAVQPESTTNGQSNPAFNYTLMFEFKEGKYRLSFNINKLYISGQYSTTWTYDTYFKNGEVRKMNEAKVERIKGLVDVLLNSHYNFLMKQMESTNDDW